MSGPYPTKQYYMSIVRPAFHRQSRHIFERDFSAMHDFDPGAITAPPYFPMGQAME